MPVPYRVQRKFLREPTDQTVAIWSAAEPKRAARGNLINLSAGGCRLTYGDAHYKVGEEVVLRGYDFEAGGVVRWHDSSSLGVEFETFE